jgi:hypothetical protein
MGFFVILDEAQMTLIEDMIENGEISVTDKEAFMRIVKHLVLSANYYLSLNTETWDINHEIDDYIERVPFGKYYVKLSFQNYQILSAISWNGMILHSDRSSLRNIMHDIYDHAVFKFGLNNHDHVEKVEIDDENLI